MPSFTPQAAAGAVQRLLLILGLATLAGVLVAGLLLPVVASAGLAARSSAQGFNDLPAELTTRPLAQRSLVFDADGRTLATFYDEYRIYRALKDIPQVMRDAILAIEDARFYEHGPIDLQGTSRALVRNLQSGTVVQGGSTLTQQYVKLLLVDAAQTKAQVAEATAATPARKLRELRLAIAAEQRFTKDQILERYLNIAYFGGGAYGVEAAARHWFGKSVSKLKLHEAALLAGLVQSPSAFDPGRNPDAARQRRNIVLSRMEAVGKITPATAARTRRTGLGIDVNQTRNGCVSSYAPFFCDFVLRELRATPSLGKTAAARERLVRRGGLRIYTTLDPKAQKAAQEAVLDRIDPTDTVAGAIAMVEPGTGRIKALAQTRGYGNRDATQTFQNYAVDQDRGSAGGFQPGSTFKVFVLAAAIQQGIPLSTRINSPDQIDLSGVPFKTCKGVVTDEWKPRSSTGSGVLDLRQGTAFSNNTFYAQLEQRTGICDPARIAAKLGVTAATGEPLLQVKSFTLGVDSVSPLTMAEAYAAFAARGKHCRSVAITKAVSTAGKSFAVPSPGCKQVLDENVADTVNSVLADVIDGPYPGRTGAPMSLSGREAAGKTGTTQDTQAVWFVGYTPQLAAAVGIADPRGLNTGPLHGRVIGGEYRGFSEVCGGCIPGPIWKQAMEGALDGVEAEPFVRPDVSQLPQQEAVVPDVRGLDLDQANRAMIEAGYRWRVTGRVNSDLPAGVVVETDPLPGTSLPAGEEVALQVSGGPG